jgi:uncharacterized coiled-coil protein SlyX
MSRSADLRGRHWNVEKAISELNLALAECRAHMARLTNSHQKLEYLGEAAREIEQALQLLRSIK